MTLELLLRQAGVNNPHAREAILKEVNAQRNDFAERDDALLSRIAAAASDPNRLPAVRFAFGQLKQLGLSVHAAADMETLNAALAQRARSPEQKIAIKTALARAGLID